MAFSHTSKKNGTTYYLHSKTSTTKGGERTLNFFKKELGGGALDAVPEGYEVVESEQTGLPLLKKKAK